MSRTHARLVRAKDAWMIVDDGSRNGVSLNGRRVDKGTLKPGDIFGCGLTLFQFGVAASTEDDEQCAVASILATVMPELVRLDGELARVAAARVPMLIVGESGVGKTHVASTLHHHTERTGELVRVEAAALTIESVAVEALARAERGTLVIENVERIAADIASVLASLLEPSPHAHLITTSIAGLDELRMFLPAPLLSRLAGFSAALPPLRDRRGDLGTLIASLDRVHLEIDEDAGLAMLRHDWPGNVRELAHTIDAATAVAGGGPIGLAHLPASLRS
jgi:DNA-binding NtrC family response regulator